MKKTRLTLIGATQRKVTKTNLATSGYRRALIAQLTETLINENKNPHEFEFDDQDVESNAVVDAGANTELMALLQKISSEIKQQSTKIEKQSTTVEQSTKIEQQSTEIKQTREKIDAKIEQQKADIDDKIIQQLRELRKQFDVKAEQQSAVVNTKIEDVRSKFDQKVIELDQKLRSG
ncbi:hypothetical protein HELRODRAFT_169321 [Helobdella robusta]|uniref:Uncharacterized protein n=1 Tax=Helobdella robusta TaxID=6412 RepID=T1F1R9_HELRO|nr:hypothetical protein HELRODRAFT_169321 [Helobdella robusta]ESO08468.1 hypothetical protein HELRODRAFT_169321 [Helobdella robusta]